MKEQEKEDNNKICVCGHRKGEHSYKDSFRCLRVMTCDCKGFKLVGEELREQTHNLIYEKELKNEK